ncbi:YrbL family protein [Pseudoxanthomonas dokdonensis]|nr:YrbL family protein [Pseudoxanthomonas dokdonensis]
MSGSAHLASGSKVPGHPPYPPLRTAHWRGLDIIGRGANRVCTRNPESPLTLLKFELPDDQRPPARGRLRLARWWARHFPRSGENHTELAACRYLRRRWGIEVQRHFSLCERIQATPWGDALVCRAVFDDDGQLARSVFACLQAPPQAGEGLVDALCAAVDDLEQWLLQRCIPLFDLNAGNLVVVHETNGLRLVCVDAKSVLRGKEIIPVSYWSKSLLRRKIRRRAQRLRQRIRASLATPGPLAEPASGH